MSKETPADLVDEPSDQSIPGQAGQAHPTNPVLRAAVGTLSALEVLGLVLITIATLVAGTQEVWEMIQAREVTLADLLLLFIYLEVLTMVGIYLESGELPVRMPLYIAMVALARHMIIGMKSMSEVELIASAAAVLILALAVLVTRYGHVRFPYASVAKSARQHNHDPG
jgi:protein PsiE